MTEHFDPKDKLLHMHYLRTMFKNPFSLLSMTLVTPWNSRPESTAIWLCDLSSYHLSPLALVCKEMLNKMLFYSLIILVFCLGAVFQLWSLILSVDSLRFNACFFLFIGNSEIYEPKQELVNLGYKFKIICRKPSVFW